MEELRYSGRRCVVIGSAGGALCDLLVDLGAEVHAIGISTTTVRGLASLSVCDENDTPAVVAALDRVGAVVNAAFVCGGVFGRSTNSAPTNSAPANSALGQGPTAGDDQASERARAESLVGFAEAIVAVMVGGSSLVGWVRDEKVLDEAELVLSDDIRRTWVISTEVASGSDPLQLEQSQWTAMLFALLGCPSAPGSQRLQIRDGWTTGA